MFKFLLDARVRIIANAAAIDARRDFLIGAVDLQAALTIGANGGGGAEAGGMPAATAPPSGME